MPKVPKRQSLASDYDSDPERRKAIVNAANKYLTTEDVHPLVADRIAQVQPASVLDVGAGEGILGRELLSRGLPWTPLDNSPNMLSSLPDNAVHGEATSLPFRDESFDAVAALYMLYHLDHPADALAEFHRVLSRRGLFAAAAPGSRDVPELAPVFRIAGPSIPHTFDSDIGPGLIEAAFGNVEVDSWDGPYVFLPDADALREYCRGYGLPATAVESAPDLVKLPLYLTKRGAVMYAKKQ